MLLLYSPAVLVVAAFVGAAVVAVVTSCERFSRVNMSSKGQTITTYCLLAGVQFF